MLRIFKKNFKVFYSIVMVCKIYCTPNKSQSVRLNAHSGIIFAFFVIFKPFLHTDTTIGN